MISSRSALTILLTALLLCASGAAARGRQPTDPADPGPFAVGFRLIGVSPDGGLPFTAWLFYPATSNGYGRALDATGAPYPAVAFGHAYLAPPLLYAATARHLASWGYAVVLPRTGVQLVPYIPAFAGDLTEALDELERRDSEPRSFLFGAIDVTSRGLAGHSMGGGAAILAAAGDPRVRALVGFSPSETFWPVSAVERISAVEAAVVLLAGTADVITPPEVHQRPMFENAAAPRILATLDGGGHCAYAPAIPSCGGTLARERQIRIAQRWLVATFNLYLKEDTRFADWVWGPLAEDPAVEVLADAGFEVEPSSTRGSAGPGRTATHELTLTHGGDGRSSYSLTTDCDAWQITAPSDTGPLDPGETRTIRVDIRVPALPARSTDRCSVVVTPRLDGLTRHSAELVISATALDR